MGANSAWSKADVRGMLRLLNTLHEHNGSDVPRPRLLLKGTCELLDAPYGLLIIGESNGAVLHEGTAVHAHGCDRPEMQPLIEALTAGELPDPAIPKLLKKVLRKPERATVTHLRAQLSQDDSWISTPETGVLRRIMRPDNTLYSAHRIGGRGIACMAVCRGDRRRFGQRDRETLHLLHEHTAWVHKDEVASPDIAALPLSPREKQTLLKLLAGRGEKQIAAEMCLSRNTVHHYVKSIYRHFKVFSRAELLARWMER